MKKIVQDNILEVLLTKCFDEETGKYYKLKDIKTGKLYNTVLTKLYSDANYTMTDIEVVKNPILNLLINKDQKKDN